MGATQSTRKITLVEDEKAGVIKLSESLAHRLRGQIEGQHAAAAAHKADEAAAQEPVHVTPPSPPLSEAPLPPPSPPTFTERPLPVIPEAPKVPEVASLPEQPKVPEVIESSKVPEVVPLVPPVVPEPSLIVLPEPQLSEEPTIDVAAESPPPPGESHSQGNTEIEPPLPDLVDGTSGEAPISVVSPIDEVVCSGSEILLGEDATLQEVPTTFAAYPIASPVSSADPVIEEVSVADVMVPEAVSLMADADTSKIVSVVADVDKSEAASVVEDVNISSDMVEAEVLVIASVETEPETATFAKTDGESPDVTSSLEDSEKVISPDNIIEVQLPPAEILLSAAFVSDAVETTPSHPVDVQETTAPVVVPIPPEVNVPPVEVTLDVPAAPDIGISIKAGPSPTLAQPSGSIPPWSIYAEEAHLMVMRLREEKEQDIKKLNAEWRQKMQAREDEFVKMAHISEEQVASALKEVEGLFMKASCTPVCQNQQEAVMHCYQDHPRQSLRCAREVEQFTQCVDLSRLQSIMKQETQ